MTPSNITERCQHCGCFREHRAGKCPGKSGREGKQWTPWTAWEYEAAEAEGRRVAGVKEPTRRHLVAPDSLVTYCGIVLAGRVVSDSVALVPGPLMIMPVPICMPCNAAYLLLHGTDRARIVVVG